MTLEEDLDTKAFTNTELIGKKNAALIFNSKLNNSLSLFGKSTSVMKSSLFMAQE